MNSLCSVIAAWLGEILLPCTVLYPTTGYFAQSCSGFGIDSPEQTVLCAKNLLVGVVIYRCYVHVHEALTAADSLRGCS